MVTSNGASFDFRSLYMDAVVGRSLRPAYQGIAGRCCTHRPGFWCREATFPTSSSG